MVSTLSIMLSTSQNAPVSSWGLPCDWLTEEERTRARSADGSAQYAAPSRSGQLQHYNLFLGDPERHCQRETFTVVRTLGSTHGHTDFLEGKMARCVIVH